MQAPGLLALLCIRIALSSCLGTIETFTSHSAALCSTLCHSPPFSAILRLFDGKSRTLARTQQNQPKSARIGQNSREFFSNRRQFSRCGSNSFPFREEVKTLETLHLLRSRAMSGHLARWRELSRIGQNSPEPARTHANYFQTDVNSRAAVSAFLAAKKGKL